jgi:hypothetical protein
VSFLAAAKPMPSLPPVMTTVLSSTEFRFSGVAINVVLNWLGVFVQNMK